MTKQQAEKKIRELKKVSAIALVVYAADVSQMNPKAKEDKQELQKRAERAYRQAEVFRTLNVKKAQRIMEQVNAT